MSADLLNYGEAAAAAGMTYSSLYKLVANRRGPRPIVVQGESRKPKVRFSRESLERWLSSRGSK